MIHVFHLRKHRLHRYLQQSSLSQSHRMERGRCRCRCQTVWFIGFAYQSEKIENVVFQAKESKRLTDNDYDIEELVKELIENHMIG